MERASGGGEAGVAIVEGNRLFRDGDRGGAEAAFRRADELGSARGAGALAWMLRSRGAVVEAEAAARRADGGGDARGAFLLGLLLGWRDAIDEGEAALSRAVERGDWIAGFSLGVMRRDHGDRDAAAAFARAVDGHSEAELLRAGRDLIGLGDLDGAEAAWRKAAELGSADAAATLGTLLFDLGDLDGAEAMWRQADDGGHGPSALRLGILLAGRYADSEADAAFTRAAERGVTSALEERERLSHGGRQIARGQKPRTQNQMTLTPTAARAMAEAIRERPRWVDVFGRVAPRAATEIVWRRARQAATRADPDGVVGTGGGVDPYLVRNLANVFARAAREDITAVRRIQARAEGDDAALQAAEQLAHQDLGSPIPERTHRLIVAAIEDRPPHPPTPGNQSHDGAPPSA